MAFMALFGWVFLPIIILYYILRLFMAPLVWAAEHPAALNALAAGLLAFNLWLLVLLLRARSRRKQAQRAGQPRKGTAVLILAALWEVWVAVCCAAYLVVQPLQYIPDGFGVPFSLENNCYGVWTVVDVQGRTPGCTQSQEEAGAFLGRQVAYREDRFASTDWAYPLEDGDAYQTEVVWSDRFPPLYGMTLEDLGISRRNLRHVAISLPEGTGEDRPLGQEFYVLDQNTLLLYRRGVFFRAERAPDLPFPDRSDRPVPPKVRDLSAPPYFGAWTVMELLGTAPEAPMDPELIEKILGTKLEYQAGFVSFDCEDVGGGGFGDPAYEEAELTPEAFRSAYGLSLEDMGLEPVPYLSVTIEADGSGVLESLEPFVQSLGNRFLLLDGETLLLCGEGAFFRAELVPGSWPMIPDPDFRIPALNGNTS